MPTRDFTAARAAATAEPVTFTIDDDTFECVPVDRVPATAIVDLTALFDVADRSKGDAGSIGFGDAATMLRAVIAFTEAVMVPASAARFAERLRDGGNPITLDQALDVMIWLVQDVYTGRPTSPPSHSR